MMMINSLLLISILLLVSSLGIVQPQETLARFGENGLFPCRCQGDVKCDEFTGDCVTGCKSGWRGPGCQIGNILEDVENNAVRQYPHNHKYWNKRAIKAIDGTCATSSETGTTTYGSEWCVIKAYYEPFVLKSVIISGLSCKSRNPSACNTAIDISFGKDIKSYTRNIWNTVPKIHPSTVYLSGRRSQVGYEFGVFIRPDNIEKSLQISEIKLIGYKHVPADKCHDDNTVGCLTECRCRNGISCDYITGNCHEGCKEGYYGYDCLEELKLSTAPTVENTSPFSALIQWRVYDGFRHVSESESIVDITYVIHVKDKSSSKSHKSMESKCCECGICRLKIENLRQGKQHTVSVRFEAELNTSKVIKSVGESDSVNFITPCEVSSGPTGLNYIIKHSPVDNKIFVTLSWKAATVCGRDYTGVYRIEYGVNSEDVYNLYITKKGETTASILLDPGANYIRVSAHNIKDSTNITIIPNLRSASNGPAISNLIKKVKSGVDREPVTYSTSLASTYGVPLFVAYVCVLFAIVVQSP